MSVALWLRLLIMYYWCVPFKPFDSFDYLDTLFLSSLDLSTPFDLFKTFLSDTLVNPLSRWRFGQPTFVCLLIPYCLNMSWTVSLSINYISYRVQQYIDIPIISISFFISIYRCWKSEYTGIPKKIDREKKNLVISPKIEERCLQSWKSLDALGVSDKHGTVKCMTSRRNWK